MHSDLRKKAINVIARRARKIIMGCKTLQDEQDAQEVDNDLEAIRTNGVSANVTSDRIMPLRPSVQRPTEHGSRCKKMLVKQS